MFITASPLGLEIFRFDAVMLEAEDRVMQGLVTIYEKKIGYVCGAFFHLLIHQGRTERKCRVVLVPSRADQ